MLTRGYLNPQSQRDSKRAEMIKKHSNKEFATISKTEDVISKWFENNNYNIYWTGNDNAIISNEMSIIRQYPFLKKYCVDFACPKRKIIVEVLGDWWHGWEFVCGRQKIEDLHPKVRNNIGLDEFRFKNILNAKWTLIKIWEHDIKNGIFVNILKEYFKD